MQAILGIVSLFFVVSAAHQPPLGREVRVAEEDIDASSLDVKTPPKQLNKSPLDDIEFVSQADK